MTTNALTPAQHTLANVQDAFHGLWELLASHPDQQRADMALQTLQSVYGLIESLADHAETLTAVTYTQQAQIEELRAHWNGAVRQLDDALDRGGQVALETAARFIGINYDLEPATANEILSLLIEGSMYPVEVDPEILRLIRRTIELTAAEITESEAAHG